MNLGNADNNNDDDDHEVGFREKMRRRVLLYEPMHVRYWYCLLISYSTYVSEEWSHGLGR